MSHFLAWTFRKKMTPICVLDKDGRRIWRVQCNSVPERVASVRCIAGHLPCVESGMRHASPVLLFNPRGRRWIGGVCLTTMGKRWASAFCSAALRFGESGEAGLRFAISCLWVDEGSRLPLDVRARAAFSARYQAKTPLGQRVRLRLQTSCLHAWRPPSWPELHAYLTTKAE